MFRLDFPVGCSDWMFRLHDPIGCSGWIFRLDVPIECSGLGVTLMCNLDHLKSCWCAFGCEGKGREESRAILGACRYDII